MAQKGLFIYLCYIHTVAINVNFSHQTLTFMHMMNSQSIMVGGSIGNRKYAHFASHTH